MEESIKQYVVEQTNALINAPSACKEAIAAAKEWLQALGTPTEKEVTAKYIKELEEDIECVDDLLAFASSPKCKEFFGEEKAKSFLAHAKWLKESGAKYCDCPACSACEKILAVKDKLL